MDVPQEPPKPTTKTARKRHKRQVRRKGTGGIERVGDQWRAKKQKRGHRPLCGTLRATEEEALADLPSLSFDPAPEPADVPTLRDWMRDQLNGRRKIERSYGTWKRDEIVWRTRVWNTDLGRMPIDQITEDHCQAWFDRQTHRIKFVPDRGEDGSIVYLTDEDGKKRARGVHVTTAVHLEREGRVRIATAVRPYFELARRKPHRLIQINPMDLIDLPAESKDDKAKKARGKSLTAEQAAGLAVNLLAFTTTLREQGPRFECMISFARDTGVRRGEVCALKWDRLGRSANGPYVLMDIGLVRGETGLQDAATKTGVVREIPIPEETYRRLIAQPRRSDYVFTTSSGRPVSPDNFNRSFRAFRLAIGMPKLKLHHLRHTYISLMLRAGVDVKTIQTLVGHADHRMIMEIYAQTFNLSMVDASARFQALLKNATANT